MFKFYFAFTLVPTLFSMPCHPALLGNISPFLESAQRIFVCAKVLLDQGWGLVSTNNSNVPKSEEQDDAEESVSSKLSDSSYASESGRRVYWPRKGLLGRRPFKIRLRFCAIGPDRYLELSKFADRSDVKLQEQENDGKEHDDKEKWTLLPCIGGVRLL